MDLKEAMAAAAVTLALPVSARLAGELSEVAVASQPIRKTCRLVAKRPSFVARRKSSASVRRAADVAADVASTSQELPENVPEPEAVVEEDSLPLTKFLVSEDQVIQVSTVAEFEEQLANAGKKLVVVEYAASHSRRSALIYPAMVDLSRRTKDAVFILVMGDESEEAEELCRRANVTKVPHFIFYKEGEIVHEEEGLDADGLLEDVLFYGDNDAPITQLHSPEDVEQLMNENVNNNKLLVIDIGLKYCGPCAKVYPAVVKLSQRMADVAVFARMFGDENDGCKQLLKQLDVRAVPTFLFVKDGKHVGRYVGSGKGELIGEILRYQGVRVTY